MATRALAAIAAVALALCAAVVMALPSQASVITGGITSITTTATQVHQFGRVDLECTWAVPDGSKPGDTFTLQLPSQLRWFGSSTFALKSPDGQTVAVAQVDSQGLVTFTLTSYVLTHPVNVHGDCRFSTEYVMATTGQNVVLDFTVGAQVISVELGTGGPCTQNCWPTHTEAAKTMWWTDGTQQSTRSRIQAPPTTADVSTVTLTDKPDAGLAIDCTSVAPAVGKTLGADGLVMQPGDAALHPAQVLCSPTSLSVTWTGLPPGEYTEVEVTTIVTDPTLSTYSNTGTVRVNGVMAPVGSQLVRTDGGGTGVGSTPPPITTPPPTTAPPTTAPTTTAPTTSPTTPPTTPPTTAAPTETAPATPSATSPPRSGSSTLVHPREKPGQNLSSSPSAGPPALAFTGVSTLPSVLLALMLVGLGGAALVFRARVERPSVPSRGSSPGK